MLSSLQLATLAGVSQGTVDRALHGRPGIRPATRTRILALAERHGYRPHPGAQELLHGRRLTVGALAPAVNLIFFMDLLVELKTALAEHDCRLSLTPYDGAEEFRDALAEFAARRVRGVFAIPPADRFPLPEHLTADMPLACVLNRCEVRNSLFLAPDEQRAGRDAVTLLADRGHRRILHVTSRRDAFGIRERARGYTAEMKARGLAPLILKPADDGALTAALAATEATALFCMNDELALRCLRALARAGRRVPEEISVLGVDNSPTFIRLCPDLTTLAWPMRELTRQAAAWLTAGTVPAGPPPPLTLVERGTVGANPASFCEGHR